MAHAESNNRSSIDTIESRNALEMIKVGDGPLPMRAELSATTQQKSRCGLNIRIAAAIYYRSDISLPPCLDADVHAVQKHRATVVQLIAARGRRKVKVELVGHKRQSFNP